MRSLLVLAALLVATPTQAAMRPAPTSDPLHGLFVALAKASSPEAAAPLERRLEAAFLNAGSDSVDLLMTRAAKMLAVGRLDVAGKLLDAVTQIAPHYAEGWHQKARLEALEGHDRAAMLSLQRTLILNPRQFEAYAELGNLLADYGDKKGALAMYRRAAALDPNYDDVRTELRALSRAVEGQSI